jgi:hypothetical protein
LLVSVVWLWGLQEEEFCRGPRPVLWSDGLIKSKLFDLRVPFGVPVWLAHALMWGAPLLLLRPYIEQQKEA